MLNIKVISVGKIKETYLREAINEYSKKLSKQINIDVIETKDEATKENASEKEINIVLEKEAERILKNIKDGSYIISLCIEGKCISSGEFAKVLKECEASGKNDITFIIGGSLGLANKIKKNSNLKLSFSKMTFPHQLMRLILIEQLYKIIICDMLDY